MPSFGCARRCAAQYLKGGMKNMKRTIRLTLAAAIVLLMGAIAYAAIVGAKKEGAVEYVGAQKEIFKTGKAASVVNLEELTGKKGVFAIGPIDGLDGEITIFDSKPYITKVRGNDYTVDKTLKHGAIFLVWTEQATWVDFPRLDGTGNLGRFSAARIGKRLCGPAEVHQGAGAEDRG